MSNTVFASIIFIIIFISFSIRQYILGLFYSAIFHTLSKCLILGNRFSTLVMIISFRGKWSIKFPGSRNDFFQVFILSNEDLLLRFLFLCIFSCVIIYFWIRDCVTFLLTMRLRLILGITWYVHHIIIFDILFFSHWWLRKWPKETRLWIIKNLLFIWCLNS